MEVVTVAVMAAATVAVITAVTDFTVVDITAVDITIITAVFTALDMAADTATIPAFASLTPSTVRAASTSASDFRLAKALKPTGWSA
jgi:hypothetical protein